jgi:zinc protease
MIEFEKFTLPNGLRIILHQDKTTPLVVVNTLYDVGSKDENPGRTGFAHLFEHLMFGGSENVKRFDLEIERAGGYSNAFTNNDITNYYEVIPSQNLETALWLESDRMKRLAFSQDRLSKQQNVVVEEFKQVCLNQPYGDVWQKLQPLAFKKHPYLWDTLGKDPSHVESATLEDVKNFFFKHYRPNHAILSIAGNIDISKTKKLIEKWYLDIPSDESYIRNLPIEPPQKKLREEEAHANVPLDAIFMAFHMDDHRSPKFYAQDLISDILSRGRSSRLYQHLVKEKKLFNSISASITGHIEPGLLVVSGYLGQGIKMKDAKDAIWEELENVKTTIEEREIEKAKNQIVSSFEFNLIDIHDRALYLAFYELLKDAEEINKIVDDYLKISKAEIVAEAKKILTKENCSILYYYSNTKTK